MKFSTTTFPRSEVNSSLPGPLSRDSVKFFGSFVAPLPCATFQIRSASSPPTSATASTCPVSFSRAGIKPRLPRRLLRGGDDDRRPDLHVGEEPLRRRDEHADAAVRGRVAER